MTSWTAILLSTILMIQSMTLESYSQNQFKDKNSFKNTIKLNTGRLILNEARFSYERQLSERHTLRTVIGFQYPTSQTEFRSVTVGVVYIPNYYKVSKGIYIGAGYNYLLGTHSRNYISAEMYFNYNYYDNKHYRLCAGGSHDSYVSLQSMNLNKTGLKIIFGKKATIISGSKIGLELDFFVGMGIQYRIEELTIYQKQSGSCSYDYNELYHIYPPDIETNKNWYPTLHAGILIGMTF